jgi:hypothetical protein
MAFVIPEKQGSGVGDGVGVTVGVYVCVGVGHCVGPPVKVTLAPG